MRKETPKSHLGCQIIHWVRKLIMREFEGSKVSTESTTNIFWAIEKGNRKRMLRFFGRLHAAKRKSYEHRNKTQSQEGSEGSVGAEGGMWGSRRRSSTSGNRTPSSAVRDRAFLDDPRGVFQTPEEKKAFRWTNQCWRPPPHTLPIEPGESHGGQWGSLKLENGRRWVPASCWVGRPPPAPPGWGGVGREKGPGPEAAPFGGRSQTITDGRGFHHLKRPWGRPPSAQGQGTSPGVGTLTMNP